MADDLRKDPYGSHFFKLEIAGEEIAEIVEASGLKNAAEVISIKEGGLNTFAHQRPGRTTWQNIILRCALAEKRTLQKWRDDYVREPFNEDHVKSGSIAVHDDGGNVVRRFHFTNAWPVSWDGPALDGGSSAMAIETIELAHEGITVTDGDE